MRKGIVACASMIFGLILLFVAFLGPWYIVSGNGILGANYNVGLYLTRMEVQGTFAGQDVSLSMGYAEAKLNAPNTDVNVESFTTINTAMYLTLFAMVTALIAIICMAAFVYNKGKPKTMKLMGGLFGILTFLLALLPALYFMYTGFVENSSGFLFSQAALGIRLSGGPGYAWYLMMVVAIIAVISAVAILIKKIVPEGASSETLPPSTN
ncbi:MAG: hypothetical protein NTZ75_02135 [Euryarchaeota archaeon]|nr:hypothetical protein [Euryarchaeota archaeon]